MTTLHEYIDHNASRLYHQLSRRKANDLHALKNIAWLLRLINDRNKLRNMAKAITVALILGLYEIPLQVPTPTPAPTCIEYCDDPKPLPPLLAETGGTR